MIINHYETYKKYASEKNVDVSDIFNNDVIRVWDIVDENIPIKISINDEKAEKSIIKTALAFFHH